MEQIERFMVLPNKLTIPFSHDVPMQVHWDILKSKSNIFPALGFQMSSTQRSSTDHPRRGKVQNFSAIIFFSSTKSISFYIGI